MGYLFVLRVSGLGFREAGLYVKIGDRALRDLHKFFSQFCAPFYLNGIDCRV